MKQNLLLQIKKQVLPLFLCIVVGQVSIAQSDTSQNLYFQIGADEMLKIAVQNSEQVSVASNVARDASRQPASVTIITHEQIKYSAARSVSELLTLFVPGFFAVEDQDDIIAGFRGLAPDNNSKVLLLLNGQNLNTEFFWGPADAILNGTDLSYIERVEVIRGPGSVTLGQGALLGVINVITQDASKDRLQPIRVGVAGGLDAYLQTNASFSFDLRGLKNHTYVSSLNYEGQTFRNEGWSALQGNQGFAGGKVFDMKHRLRRANSLTFINQTQYKNLQINLFKFNQKRDLYNFYRDREVVEQDLTGLQISYNTNLASQITNRTELSWLDDNYSLHSLTGTVMGGTAEKRIGIKTLFGFDNLFKNNRLVVGVEYRGFLMGRANRQNNNFIANAINSFNPATANEQLTMAYKQNIGLISIFAEDFYSIGSKIDLFLACRMDKHPFWGTNLSPRFGVIYSPFKKLTFRGSYQAGFRGAVGLHYSGGYRRDGFLRAENYNKVGNANIPNTTDINAIIPERINNIELSIRYEPIQHLTLNTVAFFNTVSNVIDVGVIYQDPNAFQMVDVGSDIAGDWNGYWYFKNTLGTFSQIGLESNLTYHNALFHIVLSNAIVKVQGATQAQNELAQKANSMYLAYEKDNESLHHKAYPEMVTRLNFLATPVPALHFSLNVLHYSKWYSPIGSVANGGTVLNFGAGYTFKNRLEVQLLMKNLGNSLPLYPMNSNAGGPDVSPGTPAWESRSFWTRVIYAFGASAEVKKEKKI